MSLQNWQDNAAFLKLLKWGSLVAASVFVLSGCVSAGAGQAVTGAVPVAAAVAETDEAQQPLPAETGTVADNVAVPGTAQQQTDVAATAAQQNGQAPLGDASQLASLTMQANGVQATSSSIFAVQMPEGGTQPQSVVGSDGEVYTSPSRVPLPGFNPAQRSLYQATQVPEAAADLPLTVQQDQQVATASKGIDQQTATYPVSGQQAAAGAAQRQEMAVLPVHGAEQQAAEGVATQAQADGALMPTTGVATPATTKEDKRPRKLTLSSFFGGKKKQDKTFNTTRFGEAAETKTISVENPAVVQTASLAGNNLPGVAVNSMFETGQEPAFAGGFEGDADIDDRPVEIAALPGLARLAPNGLWMQTETVESGCFRPELLTVLKSIEKHYGRKLMVTSGFRAAKINQGKAGARHSLHTACAAADIQIAGVGKWELASYLRTMPNRGGVGTYCHTESVHIDIGEPRDWNWRCRRRK